MNLNIAPYNTSAITDLDVLELETGNYTMPTLTDDEGDTITYTIRNNPSWVSYDSTTGNISYTAPDDTTLAQFDIEATDSKNDTFEHTVTINIDLKPQLNSSVSTIGGMIAQFPSEFKISYMLFSDESPSTITYELLNDDGDPAEPLMNLIPATTTDDFVIYGKSIDFFEGSFYVQIKATDEKGLVNSATIEVFIQSMPIIFDLFSILTLNLIHMLWKWHR